MKKPSSPSLLLPALVGLTLLSVTAIFAVRAIWPAAPTIPDARKASTTPTTSEIAQAKRSVPPKRSGWFPQKATAYTIQSQLKGAAAKRALSPPMTSTLVDQRVLRYQKAIRKNPEKKSHWVRLGQSWIRKARRDSDPGYYLYARDAALVVLRVAPDYRPALNLIALVYHNDHKFQQAVAVTTRILAINKKDVMALGTRSDAFLELGRYKEAEQAAQGMMDAKPSLPSYSRAAYFMWLRGNTKGAVEAMRLAFDAGRNHGDREPAAWVLSQAAEIFWQEGDLRGALAGYNLTLRFLKDYPPGLQGKAKVLLAQGKATEAVALLRRALKRSPKIDIALDYGEALEALGQHQKAAQVYAKAIPLGRRSDPRTLSLFLSRHKRAPGEALRLAQQEFKKRQDILSHDAMAWALYRNKQYAKAKKHALQAIRLGTRDARLLSHAGYILRATGDTAQANKLLAQAKALNPARMDHPTPHAAPTRRAAPTTRRAR